MAEKVTVTLVDDLDGSQAEETVRFGLGDTHYEIDLSKKNAKALRDHLAPFIEHARKVTLGGERARPKRTAASRRRSAEIRAWARRQGMSLSDRGRIPDDVVEQYETAAEGR